MFIKMNKSKNYVYVQLVRAYREGGKNKHKVLFNFGRLDELKDSLSLEKVAKKLLTLSGVNSTYEVFNEAEIFNWGYLVYKNLWQRFELDTMLSDIQVRSRSKFDLNNACFLMAVQHLLSPGSKLSTYNDQQRYAKLPGVDLNHLYRSLDILSDNKEAIELHLFNKNRDLFNMRVDIVFYDVTTFHFESTKKDDLKDFGFSKANKVNEVQVVLGMLMDCEGRPIGYELFSGNTFEGKTLEKALNTIEKRFGIRNVIIVADRGLNSKLNLKQIVDKGYGYIVASRIKSLKKETQEKIFNGGYQTLSGDISYKVIDHVNSFKKGGEVVKLFEKLIITYSKGRAEKDRQDRKRFLEKAQILLSNKSLIKSSNKRGGKKYIKEVGHADWILDEAALAKDVKFDGYYAIQTSNQNLNVETILDAYHSLWKIEESFRIMKTTLEVRPIFHWTENRIKGHFVMCFLAFLLERTLEFRLKENRIEATPNKIREALNNMQFAAINFNNQKLFIKTKGTELGPKILRILRIKPPKNVTPITEFSY
jgi:transposase